MFILIKYAYFPFKSHFKFMFLLLALFLTINLAGPHLPRPLAVYTVSFALFLFAVYCLILINFITSTVLTSLELLYLQIPQPPSKPLAAYMFLVFVAVFLCVVSMVLFFPVSPHLLPYGLTFVAGINILTLALHGIALSLAFALIHTTLTTTSILAINKWVLIPARILAFFVITFYGIGALTDGIGALLYPIGSFMHGEILIGYASVLHTPLDTALRNLGLISLLIAVLFVSIVYLIKNKLN